MKLLGRNKLLPLYGIDEQTDKWLISWTSELSRANWKNPGDVARQFPQSRSPSPCVFEFQVGSQTYAVEIAIMFPLALAIVTDLKRRD